MRFVHHSQVINFLIEKFKYRYYLEIGVHVPRDNFDLIKCKFKIGVDPNGAATFTGTSDEYFSMYSKETWGHSGFDIVFIDGLHHADQVKKDLENSLVCLNEGGIILLHDTNPADERYTRVPRDLPTGKRWNGDVFKIFTCLSDFGYRTLNFDSNGLTVVKPGGVLKEITDLSYHDFDKNRKYLVRACTDEQFEEWI